MGWSGIRNGRLLAIAASDGFEAIVTIDQSMPDQQNRGALQLSIVVLQARSNRFHDLIDLVPRLLVVLNHMNPKSISYVS
jgi:hypothetical protein